MFYFSYLWDLDLQVLLAGLGTLVDLGHLDAQWSLQLLAFLAALEGRGGPPFQVPGVFAGWQPVVQPDLHVGEAPKGKNPTFKKIYTGTYIYLTIE